MAKFVRPFAPARDFDGGEHRRGECIKTVTEAFGFALGHNLAYFNRQTADSFGSVFNHRVSDRGGGIRTDSFWNAGQRPLRASGTVGHGMGNRLLKTNVWNATRHCCRTTTEDY